MKMPTTNQILKKNGRVPEEGDIVVLRARQGFVRFRIIAIAGTPSVHYVGVPVDEFDIQIGRSESFRYEEIQQVIELPQDPESRLQEIVSKKHRQPSQFISISSPAKRGENFRVIINFPSYTDEKGVFQHPPAATEQWKQNPDGTWSCVRDGKD